MVTYILLRFLTVPLALLSMLLLPIISRVILGPISQLAGALKAPTRFQLSDFVWLLVIIQAVLGGVVQLVGVETRGMFEAILLYLLFAATALWGGAVSYLSRAGVTDPRRRALFTLIVLPATLAIMICLPAGLVLALVNGADRLTRYGGGFTLREIRNGVLICIAVALLLPTAIWALRKAAIWVADSELPLSTTPAEDQVSSTS